MRKVLVVEDDAMLAESLQALLKVKGYRVFFAADGQSAIETARREMPEIILLDLLLPVLGGIDVCRILKSEAKTSAIKIIALTALGRMGDVETAFAAGANDYVTKPYDNERLIKKIEKVLADGQQR